MIKKNGLTPGMVAKRVRGGWALLEALHATYGMRLAEYKELVSEEMRLVYVALTRAKEQLYLIGRVKNDKSLLELEQLS
ncbi:SA1788 family PVL leukocidin-associated protein, partial [Staphylococcus aureus]|uniref:SA1788 family PVL leukocidin-associated protein n=1 Tax=Staphylococcus aureus TaxID=1280 RepID=UPI00272E3AE4